LYASENIDSFEQSHAEVCLYWPKDSTALILVGSSVACMEDYLGLAFMTY